MFRGISTEFLDDFEYYAYCSKIPCGKEYLQAFKEAFKSCNNLIFSGTNIKLYPMKDFSPQSGVLTNLLIDIYFTEKEQWPTVDTDEKPVVKPYLGEKGPVLMVGLYYNRHFYFRETIRDWFRECCGLEDLLLEGMVDLYGQILYKQSPKKSERLDFFFEFLQTGGKLPEKSHQKIVKLFKQNTALSKDRILTMFLEGSRANFSGTWVAEGQYAAARKILAILDTPVENLKDANKVRWLSLVHSEESFIKQYNLAFETYLETYSECLQGLKERWVKVEQDYKERAREAILDAWEDWQEEKNMKKRKRNENVIH